MTVKRRLDHLNPAQQKGVETTEGRVLILAGAGSGKTSVLVHRIAHLIEDKDVPPSQILGLTFTNKAAGEMRERVAKMIGKEQAKEITLSTFHSFCMRVLRTHIDKLGYTKRFSIYSEREMRRMISDVVRHMLKIDGQLPSLESTLAKISEAKSQAGEEISIDIDHPTWHDSFSKDLIGELETAMRAYNAVDFDSLLTLTLTLFKEFPEVLGEYQEKYRYIMVDEYQDTNPVQYQITAMLSAKYGNLCVVGDDDQSIYGWRGAAIKHILQFESDHVIKLEQNYRSTPRILQAANAVIQNNQERHKKELWSTQDAGDLIQLFHAPTDVEEAQSVIDRAIAYKQKTGCKWGNIAILYRSNLLARPIEMTLLNAVWQKGDQFIRGIPYKIFGGTELYERSEVKDLMAYLRIISNPLDTASILRVINVPRRGISSGALDILTQHSRKEGSPLWNTLEEAAASPEKFSLSSKASAGVKSFVSIITTCAAAFDSKALTDGIKLTIEKGELNRSIDEEVKSDTMRAFKRENLQACINAMSSFEDDLRAAGNEEEISLENFLSTTSLDRDRFESEKDRGHFDSLNLMTFHSSKGLEFEVCFLIGLEDHIVPHERSIIENGVEEERRLMYVAMTRAKKKLILSMSRMRKTHGKDLKTTPSRFLFEIPKDLIALSPHNSREI